MKNLSLALLASERALSGPNREGRRWVCVDLLPVKALKRPVGLDAIKADKILQEMPLVRQSRLSVMPLTEAQSSACLSWAKPRYESLSASKRSCLLPDVPCKLLSRDPENL